MKYSWQKVLVMCALAISLAAPAAFAQKYEGNAYGGFYWPGTTNVGRLQDSVILGGRFGYFFEPSFELEGNVGYINHFKVSQVDARNRAMLYEVAANYNFSEQDWGFSEKFMPFLVVGGGALRSNLKDFDTFEFLTPDGRTVVMNNHNNFFNVSYGGGIKSARVLGPIGLRFDIRGRTLPNYYHSTPTWLELSGGINFMWGER